MRWLTGMLHRSTWIKFVRQSLPVSVCCMTWMLYRTRHRLWDGPYLCVVWREHYTELDFLQSFLLLELFCGHGRNCSFLRSYDAENMKNYFEKRYIFMTIISSRSTSQINHNQVTMVTLLYLLINKSRLEKQRFVKRKITSTDFRSER